MRTVAAFAVLFVASVLYIGAVRSHPPHNLVHIEPTTTTTEGP
jgi:hypothetical protein